MDREAGERPIPVQVVEVQRRNLQETLSLTGKAQAWESISVSSELHGRVLRIYAHEGDWVKVGDLLLELDAEKLQLELEVRRAELSRLNIEVDFARTRLERARTLLERGAIAQAQVDDLEQALKSGLAAVQTAELQIQRLEREYRDRLVFSPARGKVAQRFISVGELASPGTPLLEILQLDPLKVVSEIGESNLSLVEAGKRVQLSFEAYPGRFFQGVVHLVASQANPRSGGFPVEVRLDNPDRLIQPGMTATLLLAGRSYLQALVAPLDSVVDYDGESFVFRVDQDGRAWRRPVKIKARVGELAILEGDLQEGDRLVTQGNLNLTDGTLVEVVS